MRLQHKHIRGHRAFTLAELLIVLAIIAVLVGISIPIFLGQKEKSAEAADIANMRAAKAAAVQLYYEGISSPDDATACGLYWYGYQQGDSKSGNIWGVYDADTGKFISKSTYNSLRPSLTPYGQGTPIDGGTVYDGYNNTFDYTKAVITVTIYPDGLTSNQLKTTAGGKYNNASYVKVPCIIIEWRHTDSTSFVGRTNNNQVGTVSQIIFLYE